MMLLSIDPHGSKGVPTGNISNIYHCLKTFKDGEEFKKLCNVKGTPSRFP